MLFPDGKEDLLQHASTNRTYLQRGPPPWLGSELASFRWRYPDDLQRPHRPLKQSHGGLCEIYRSKAIDIVGFIYKAIDFLSKGQFELPARTSISWIQAIIRCDSQARVGSRSVVRRMFTFDSVELDSVDLEPLRRTLVHTFSRVQDHE